MRFARKLAIDSSLASLTKKLELAKKFVAKLAIDSSPEKISNL
jgi:hypothetical protein